MIKQKLQETDWEFVTNEMNEKGCAVIPKILTDDQCNKLIQGYDNPNAYRKTVIMKRYHFGLGEYKYFNYPLPEIIQQIRQQEICFGGNSKLKIYGTLSCASGKKMKRGNRVFFASEKEAIASGFRPCGHCLKETYQKWKNEII